jgi:curved DNA-binding protein CbpA
MSAPFPDKTLANKPHAGKFSVQATVKFNDHYAILGVDATADDEVIERAYARMLEKYGPENIDTRDDEKMATIRTAHDTLSNAELRKEFDALKGVAGDRGRPLFTGSDFFEVLGQSVGLRIALLCVFYDRRRNKPFTPALSMRHIESIVEGTQEALTFALWYLKQHQAVVDCGKNEACIRRRAGKRNSRRRLRAELDLFHGSS